MIPWMREKFAERRARWIASRKRSENTQSTQNLSQQRASDQKPNSSLKIRTSEGTSKSISPTTSASKSNTRRIKILSPLGKMINLQVDTGSKIFDIKQQALQQFSQDSGSLPLFAVDVKQLYAKYRIIRTDSDQQMHDDSTVEDAGIYDNEMFILAVKRTTSQCLPETFRAPTAEEIILATKDVPQSKSKPPKVDFNELVTQSDLNFDVRKVLISLAQESAYVIGASPYAPRLISTLKQKLANKKKHQADTVQCLVDMGFPREKVKIALKLKNGMYTAALDWLIEHQSDIKLNDDSPDSSSETSSISPVSNSVSENIEALLEIVRIYSQREIPPPPETVRAMIEMGFEENQVIDALKRTQNNQAAACEWLCGNRSKSLTELREGLASESPILKAMMESNQVQMSLGNPKVFLAYLSMLENHNALSMWLGDSDTSVVLSHILRKYHEEKHILGINQFNSVQ